MFHVKDNNNKYNIWAQLHFQSSGGGQEPFLSPKCYVLLFIVICNIRWQKKFVK